MKYIFLDIDGVLNSGQNAWKFIHNPELLPQYRFLGKGDWVEVELLNRLIGLVKDEDAKIVGVSSWFTFIKDPKAELKEIEDVLMLPVYDVSHSTGGGVHRGHGVFELIINVHNLLKNGFGFQVKVNRIALLAINVEFFFRLVQLAAHFR